MPEDLHLCSWTQRGWNLSDDETQRIHNLQQKRQIILSDVYKQPAEMLLLLQSYLIYC